MYVGTAVDLYLFDFDKTLYGYDFHHRLPSLSRMSGVSQYDLASSWWGGGFEARAEAGEWPDADSYLAKFAEVTGAQLSLRQWQDARLSAMTRFDGSIEALRRCVSLGTVALFSNNPWIFAESLPRIAPEVSALLDGNVVLSCMLRARKPTPESYERVLEHFGASAENTFFADDNPLNIAGALNVGIVAHHFTTTEFLDEAITAFAERTA
jgi:HAD superfamily hydrolase (TIGR01509 family)